MSFKGMKKGIVRVCFYFNTFLYCFLSILFILICMWVINVDDNRLLKASDKNSTW